MTWDEWLGVLARAAERLGPQTGTVDETSARRWFDEDLRELPAELVEDAVLSFYRAGEKWFPHGGAIAKRVKELPGLTEPRPPVVVEHTQQAAAAWAAALPAMKQAIGADDVFSYWLEPLRPLAIEQGVLYVEAVDADATWIRRRFKDLMSTAVAAAAPGIVRVEVVRAEGRKAA